MRLVVTGAAWLEQLRRIAQVALRASPADRGRLYTRNARRFPDNVEIADIVKGLPVAGQSFDGICCSHVLEHLALEEFRIAVRNTYRMLKPGGLFRLVVPDLECLVNRYTADSSDGAALRLLRSTGLGMETRDRGFRQLPVALYGNSRHLWMWDFKAIRNELQQAGFIDVRRARFGDSPDAAFCQVEERGRWEDCLGVECRRPADHPPRDGA